MCWRSQCVRRDYWIIFFIRSIFRKVLGKWRKFPKLWEISFLKVLGIWNILTPFFRKLYFLNKFNVIKLNSNLLRLFAWNVIIFVIKLLFSGKIDHLQRKSAIVSVRIFGKFWSKLKISQFSSPPPSPQFSSNNLQNDYLHIQRSQYPNRLDCRGISNKCLKCLRFSA